LQAATTPRGVVRQMNGNEGPVNTPRAEGQVRTGAEFRPTGTMQSGSAWSVGS